MVLAAKVLAHIIQRVHLMVPLIYLFLLGWLEFPALALHG